MKLFLPIVIVLILTAGYFTLTKNGAINLQTKNPRVQSPSPTPQLKTFKSSSVMDFNVEVPNEFSVEEKHGSVIISNQNEKISILQNGTNFKNINDYLEFLKEKNRFRLTDEKSLQINGLSVVTGFIEDEKIYLIFSKENYTVYSLSTKSKDLYSDLDQIAQSFRYTP